MRKQWEVSRFFRSRKGDVLKSRVEISKSERGLLNEETFCVCDTKSSIFVRVYLQVLLDSNEVERSFCKGSREELSRITKGRILCAFLRAQVGQKTRECLSQVHLLFVHLLVLYKWTTRHAMVTPCKKCSVFSLHILSVIRQ